MSSMYVAVRTSVDPESIVPSVRTALAAIDRDVAMDRVQTMQTNLDGSLARPRFRMTLLALLSFLGLILAGIGVYGVVAYSVSQKTSELGIRAALGASRQELIWLVLRNGMKPVLAGLTVGCLGALALGQLMLGMLFGVKPHDSVTLLSGIGVLCGVGLLACLVPALRAIRIDPIVALRRD